MTSNEWCPKSLDPPVGNRGRIIANNFHIFIRGHDNNSISLGHIDCPFDLIQCSLPIGPVWQTSKPTEPHGFWTMAIASLFISRARMRPASPCPAIAGPGVEIDRIPLMVPTASIAAIADSGVQFRSSHGPEGSPPAAAIARLKLSGRKWKCVSMRLYVIRLGW